jgi:serine/threonine-protein kinase
LPIALAALFVLQACEAVAAAHAIGIVHRDLKPSNLFVIRLADGTLSVKVLDFGISKFAGRDPTDASITSTAVLLGSPLYMPPEQMRSARDVDARSDIWALGALLHELVAGKPAFSGASLADVMASVLDGAPESLRAALPDAPVELEGVIAKCLQKQREHRYANVGALANALLPFAPPRGRLSVERIEGMLRASGADETELLSGWPRGREGAAASATRASWGGTHSGARRSPTPLRVGVLAGAGLAGLVAISWFVLSRPAVVPEKHDVPVASEVSAAVVPASPAPVASNEIVVQPVGSVPVPTPSALPAAVGARRKGRAANQRAAPPTPTPSARVEPAPPIPPSPPLSGGAFEDRK